MTLEEPFTAIILWWTSTARWWSTVMLLNWTLGWKILWGTLGVQLSQFMEEEIYEWDAESSIARVKVSQLVKWKSQNLKRHLLNCTPVIFLFVAWIHVRNYSSIHDTPAFLQERNFALMMNYLSDSWFCSLSNVSNIYPELTMCQEHEESTTDQAPVLQVTTTEL